MSRVLGHEYGYSFLAVTVGRAVPRAPTSTSVVLSTSQPQRTFTRQKHSYQTVTYSSKTRGPIPAADAMCRPLLLCAAPSHALCGAATIHAPARLSAASGATASRRSYGRRRRFQVLVKLQQQLCHAGLQRRHLSLHLAFADATPAFTDSICDFVALWSVMALPS